MKKLLILIAMAVATVTVMADTQRYVGYTVTDDIDVSGAAFGEAGTYTVGALLPKEMLTAYAGCRVLGIRYALSQSIGRTRAFMYDATDNQFTEISAQKQRTYEGWNTVLFNGDGYVITGQESLFFGFDYVESEEMVAAEKGALCGVGSETTGAFYLYGNYGQGEGLYSISGVGRLCVQLIVDVSSLPEKDIDVTYLDTGHKYKISGSKVEVFSLFNNVGRDTVFTYRMGCQIDDREPIYQEFADTLLCGEEEKWETAIVLTDDYPVGMHTLKLFVSEIDGQPVENTKNDTLQAQFAVYRDALPRHQVYVEVYAHQQSPYVPMLDKALAKLSEEVPFMALANIFSFDDALFVPEADYLHQLYAYTYPTFTFNRAYFPGEAHIAYDINDYLAQVPAEFIAGILSDMLYQDYMNPAFATIELQPEYDPTTRQLTVNVSGEALPEVEAIYGDMALTVLLTEDGVKSPQAVYNEITGRTTTQQNYQHNKVLRQFVTDPLGQTVDIADGQYTASVSTTLSDDWNPEQMHIVAFLTKAATEVTDDNVLEMDITNANSCDIPIVEPTAISQLELDADGAPLSGGRKAGLQQAYTLDGQPIGDLSRHHGIAILRSADGKTRKIVMQ